MLNRSAYLSSLNDNGFESDFIRYKNAVVTHIQEIEKLIGSKLPEFQDDKETENADPEIRKNKRGEYVKAFEEWIKHVEKSLSRSSSSDDSGALLAESHAISTLAKSLDQSSKQAINTFLLKMKAFAKLLEEARQVERFVKITEVRIDAKSNSQRVNELKYYPERHHYEHEDLKANIQQNPAFRIVNGRRFQDPEEFVTSVDEKEYAALQELGATLNYRVQGRLVDKSFTSQLIGEYGDYRRKALYALVRREETTATFAAKEAICQHVINRFRALQLVESAYGGSIQDLQKQLAAYKAEIIQLQQEAINGLVRISKDRSLTAQQQRWFKNIYETYQEGLIADMAKAHELEAKIEKVLEKYPAINQTVELSKNDPHDIALTKSVLADWLRFQGNDIIGSGTLAGDLVDISGRWFPSNGQFSKAAANATHRCKTFEFPNYGRMHPAYQGQFSGTRYISSADLAHGQRDTRNVLFALICVKAGLTTPEQVAEMVAEIKPNSVTSRGWARLLCCSRAKQREEINQRISTTEKLTRAQLINQLYETLRERVQATNETFSHAFIKVWGYMWDATRSTVKGAWQGTKECAATFATDLQRDFTYTDMQMVKKQEEVPAESKRSHDLEAAVETRELTPFEPWNPRTLYSVLDEFLIQFGGFFIRRYEAAPFIWTVGTLFGAMSGLTAFESAIPTVREFYQRIGFTAQMADKLIDMSIAISKATTESQMFQFIGTTTTVQQAITFLALEFLAEGADSAICQAGLEVRRNLPVVLAVLGGATGFGWGLGQASAFVRGDFGTQPVIAEFFSGLKVAGFLYESTQHEPGERSALANTVAWSFGAAGDVVRAGASVVNLLLMPAALCVGQREMAAKAGSNFWRPWLKLMDTSLGVLVSTIDTGLRVGTTVAQGTAAVAKAALVETPINALAKFPLTPECVSESLLKAKASGKQKVGHVLAGLHNHTTRRFRRFYEDRTHPTHVTPHQAVNMFGSRRQARQKQVLDDAQTERKTVVLAS